MNTPFRIVVRLLCFLLSGTLLYSQTPALVSDFNVGSLDGFNEFDYEGVSFNGDLFFQLTTESAGTELGVLKDGVLSILKDLNPGDASSDPLFLTEYQGLLYFSAEDEENGGAIWVSDGTEAGTSMLFDPGDSDFAVPSGLIVSENGLLYFTYSFELFVFDGTTFTSIQEGAQFEKQWLHDANNYCHYNGEIAFLQKYNNSDLELYVTNGAGTTLLGSTPSSLFTEAFGLNPVDAGLIFSGSDLGTVYVYRTSTGSIDALQIADDDPFATRLYSVDDQTTLAYVQSQGAMYSLNGNDNDEVLLYESTGAVSVQGQHLPHASYQGKTVVQIDLGFFEEKFLVYTDGTAAGTVELTELGTDFGARMVQDGAQAVFATGISNGFSPQLYSIDLLTGEFEIIHEFSESSSIRSVLPMAIHNGQLYFNSNLDTDVGRELYVVDLAGVSGLEDVEVLPFHLRQNGRSLMLEANSDSVFGLSLFDLNGRELDTSFSGLNHWFTLDQQAGVYVVQIELDGKRYSQRVLLVE